MRGKGHHSHLPIPWSLVSLEWLWPCRDPAVARWALLGVSMVLFLEFYLISIFSLRPAEKYLSVITNSGQIPSLYPKHKSNYQVGRIQINSLVFLNSEDFYNFYYHLKYCVCVRVHVFRCSKVLDLQLGSSEYLYAGNRTWVLRRASSKCS